MVGPVHLRRHRLGGAHPRHQGPQRGAERLPERGRLIDTPTGQERQRWFTAFDEGHSAAYVRRMRRLTADGGDHDGEARFVDALLPRAARVLDAGCGTGRVGAALHRRGHRVLGVDVDPVLIAAAREDHPGPEWAVGDLAAYRRGDEPFDAVVLAGNVIVYLTPGSEAAVLRGLREVLVDGGVLVAGFATGHPYGADDFDRDAAAAGLTREHRFAGWDLAPWRDDAGWAVTVVRR